MILKEENPIDIIVGLGVDGRALGNCFDRHVSKYGYGEEQDFREFLEDYLKSMWKIGSK